MAYGIECVDIKGNAYTMDDARPVIYVGTVDIVRGKPASVTHPCFTSSGRVTCIILSALGAGFTTRYSVTVSGNTCTVSANYGDATFMVMWEYL